MLIKHVADEDEYFCVFVRKAVEMLATQGLTNASICSQSQVAIVITDWSQFYLLR
jgi:hypothetical protein